MLTQPLKWHGGKYYLAEWIIRLMPYHVHYVEPFFGGGAVLLRKNPHKISEVVNDIDGYLTNFWNCLQNSDTFKLFQEHVQKIPFSQNEFTKAWEYLEALSHVGWPLGNGAELNVDAALAFFVLARQSRQGLMKDFATLSRNRTRRDMNEQVSSWLGAIEGLPDIHRRLSRVVILNTQATEVIRQQDGPNTLFYCDPPYLHETRSSVDCYRYEMTLQGHEQLLECLAAIKGKFLLSGYPSSLYMTFAAQKGWHCARREIDNKASSAESKEIKTECIWMNF